MSAVDEGITRAQALYIKMDQIDDRVKTVEAKVSDGMGVLSQNTRETLEFARGIDKKIDENWTGLETGQASIYGEVTDVKNVVARVEDDVVKIANDVATVGDEVARLAYMVEQLAKKQVIMLWIIIIMLGIIVIMLGFITYVQSLPVTVCPWGPHHAEPVDMPMNPTNTHFGHAVWWIDTFLHKCCRPGFSCQREV